MLRFLTVHAAKQTELLTEIRDRLPKPQTATPVMGTLHAEVDSKRSTGPSGGA